MDILECVKNRKSIRGYKKDPVPRELIKEILDISTRAPSGLNTQPWEFLVIGGDALDNIRQANVEKYTSGLIPDAANKNLTGIYKQRQVYLAKQIFKLMDIAREDRAKRDEWMQKGLRFFDAPAAIIVTMDKEIENKNSAMFDLGIISQTICLVALNFGLGTCIGIQGIAYPDVIRKFTGLPDSKRIVMGIAVGYPDWNFPANQLISEREPVENISIWSGFNDYGKTHIYHH